MISSWERAGWEAAGGEHGGDLVGQAGHRLGLNPAEWHIATCRTSGLEQTQRSRPASRNVDRAWIGVANRSGEPIVSSTVPSSPMSIEEFVLEDVQAAYKVLDCAGRQDLFKSVRKLLEEQQAVKA